MDHSGVVRFETVWPLLPVGQVQGGDVPLDDATVVLPLDQVGDAAKEVLPGVRVQTYVAGVGAQDAQVALRVVGLVPPVVARLMTPSNRPEASISAVLSGSSWGWGNPLWSSGLTISGASRS